MGIDARRQDSRSRIMQHMMENCTNIDTAQTPQEISEATRLDATTIRRIFAQNDMVGIIESSRLTNTKPARQYHFDMNAASAHMQTKRTIQLLNPDGDIVPKIPNNDTALSVIDITGLTDSMRQGITENLVKERGDWEQHKQRIIGGCNTLIGNLNGDYREEDKRGTAIVLSATILQLLIEFGEISD